MTAKNLSSLFYIQPPTRLTVDQWAEKYRVLPPSHAIPGPFTVAEHEVMRGPMRAATVPTTRKITIMASPQVGKSAAMENVLGFFMSEEPCPAIWLVPSESLALDFARQRLNPMLHETAILNQNYAGGGRRGSDSLLYKKFANSSSITVAYAGSESQLAQRTARLLCVDEVDRLPVLSEGDSLALAHHRTATYSRNSLIVQACSPTWSETSKINAEYNRSDKRKPFVQCPHCAEWEALEFFSKEFTCATVEWPKTEDGERQPHLARLICGFCKQGWSEVDRMKAITTKGGVRWMQTREFNCECSPGVLRQPLNDRQWDWSEDDQCGYALCECGKRGVAADHAGFQCSKLYTQDETVPSIAKQWLVTKEEAPESAVTFRNLVLGEAHETRRHSKTVQPDELSTRLETIPELLPALVLCVTAGIDIQIDRLEVGIYGWGAGEESWVLDHHILSGDPQNPEIFTRLWTLIRDTSYKADMLGDGTDSWRLKIAGVCVDSGDGNVASMVYRHVQQANKFKSNVWACKGHNDRGGKEWQPIIPPLKQSASRGVASFPIMIGVNSAKQKIYDRLAISESGPGFIHLNARVCNDAWLSQLTAERLKVTIRDGFKTARYEKKRPSAANESLDCFVLAMAALNLMIDRHGFSFEKEAALIQRELQSTPQVAVRAPRARSAWMDG